MRVWLSEALILHFTCPAAINVWKAAWAYLKLCDVGSTCISAFKICFPLALPLSPIILLLLHMCIRAHISLWSCTEFLNIFFSACSLGFISAKFYQYDGVWILDKCWIHFICETEEPPAGRVFIRSLLLMWVENSLSLGNEIHQTPPFSWLWSFNWTNFHIWLNGFPLETLMPTLTKKLMWCELSAELMRASLCLHWIYLELILMCSGLWL